MTRRRAGVKTALLLGLAVLSTAAVGPDQRVSVALEYGAPGSGPTPNFSPKGTQVPLTDAPAGLLLPAGAIRPARVGTMQVGPDRRAWVPMLVTADPGHPADLCRLYLDRNRNGRFDDDGPAVVATPTENEKTKAWWSSFAKTEVEVPYAPSAGGPVVEPYLVNVWIVRESAGVPTVARYSVASWRAGHVTIDGVDALVAVMDSNNDAVFDRADWWAVMGAAEPDAAKRVLSLAEARPMSRLMFLEGPDKERVLEFRKLSPDGRSLELAVVNRAITKAADRAPDDELAPERSRPRTATPVTWAHGQAGYTAALAQAKANGRRVLLDFEATWCGPCKQMDEWVWNDQDVAQHLRTGYVGVKLDGDIETALVARFQVHGYPTGIVLDSAGHELSRFDGYKGSAGILAFLGVKPPPAP